MRYSLIKVTGRGVVLWDWHRRRLAPEGGAAAEAFARFADGAAPGVWAVRIDDAGRLTSEARGPSRLYDGMPVRLRVSPCANRRGEFPKPDSPGEYDGVRERGVASLLTSADGKEILEACSAAVLGFDGERFLVPPADRPRVWSTAAAAVREKLPVREAALLVESELPLVLVNAVKGPCVVEIPGRPRIDQKAIAALEQLFESY